MTLPFKLISTDFDGTIFAEFENPAIPHRLQALLGELQRQGVKWVVNTGRDMSSLMEALARTGTTIEPDYLVLVEREIHCHQNSQYVSLAEWNESCTRCHGEVFSRLRRHLPALVDWINARFHTRIYEDSYSPLCLIASNNGDMDVIHNYLEEFCQSVPDLTIVRNDVYARFSHVAFSKGTAMAELSRRLGVGPAEVFAIGDHLNDLPMLSRRFAHFLAAPANAVPLVRETVRRQAGYLCRRSHGAGVAEAIKYYLAGSTGGTLTIINDKSSIMPSN